MTSITDIPDQVEEGDCRYLPKEILAEDFQYLTKADIFSLGLSIYEAASGSPLPKNGEKWQELRSGLLPYLSHYSKDFNDLLRVSKVLLFILILHMPFFLPSYSSMSHSALGSSRKGSSY